MILCLLFFKKEYSIDSIILAVTGIVLYMTARIMKKGNDENARLNRIQAQENTILKQLELHYNLLARIRIPYADAGMGFGFEGAPTYASGQEAFKLLYEILKGNYQRMPGNTYKNKYDADAEEGRIQDAFTRLYTEYGSLLGNYFKNLYLLIKYIDSVSIKDFDKQYYMDLVKSQLSKYEILLLAYDCIWIQDKPKGQNFVELASRNNLLSALEADELIQSVSEVRHIDVFRDRYGILFGEPIEFKN